MIDALYPKNTMNYLIENRPETVEKVEQPDILKSPEMTASTSEHSSRLQNKTFRKMSDEELVEHVKGGAEAAFAELVTRYMRKSYSIAYQYVGDFEVARDLSQDVFVKIHSTLSTFQEGRKFFSWFYRILLNHCINYNRRKKIVSMLSFQDAFPHGEDVADGNSVDKKDEQADLRAVVRRAVGKLSKKHRDVVMLVELEEFSQQEAADILAISVGTVRSRLHYARNHLKDFLEG